LMLERWIVVRVQERKVRRRIVVGAGGVRGGMAQCAGAAAYAAKQGAARVCPPRRQCA